MTSPDPSSHSNALVGRVVADKFRLRAVVGMGSSGTVYRADQVTLGRTVAVKILNEDLARDPRLVKRFHDEALAASRLNHPNTVSVIDYGQTTDGLLYLVMEYLRGPTLTQLVQKQFPIGHKRAGELVAQILTGLEEAHHAGVIHADLKSDNIVVDQRRGAIDVVKVVDFGIARLITAPSRAADDRTICGTPEYMAPEIIGGAEPGFASDLYAVGVILYELLVGQTPFAGGSTMEILTRQLKTEPVAPGERRPDDGIPRGLDALVLRALSKRPGDRFGSAAELLRALTMAAAAAATPPSKVVTLELDAAPCAGCGTTTPVRFKFCPECGHPRPFLQSVSDIASAAAELPRVRLRGPRGTPDIAAGLFPLPLVGRDQALTELVAFLDDNFLRPAPIGGSVAVAGSVLMIAGPSGSGKSRLLREAYSQIAIPRGLTIYQASPDPTGLACTFYPVRAMVAAILQLPPVCGLDELGEALDGIGVGRRDLPGIAELFGQQSDLWHLEPPVRRRELLAATTRVLRAGALRSPSALVFEDIDLFDQPSRDVVMRLAERSEPGLRIVITCTDAFARHWMLNAPRIELGDLPPEAIDRLAEHLGRVGRDGMPTAAQLRDLDDHLPHRVHELARFAAEGGVLSGAPARVADLIAARTALLAHDPRLVCQAAAVCGVESERDVLHAMIRAELAGGFDAALENLVLRNLVRVSDGLVTFSHALIREVVYDATPADVRRSLHAAAATELSSGVADSGVLGHHHDLAGNAERAAEHLMRAGDVAVHQHDDDGAASLYQRASMAARRALMGGSDDADSRLRFVALSVKLADALRAGGELALARGVIEEARMYSDTPFFEAQLLRASAHLSASEEQSEPAITSLRRATGLAIQTGNMELVSELYLDLSALLLQAGDGELATRELAEAIDVVTSSEGATAKTGPASLWRLLMRLAQLKSARDERAAALHLGECALMHARRANSRLGSARVQSMLATDWERAGNSGKAERYREAAVNEMRRLGDRRGTAELLLAGTAPTRTLLRIAPSSLREAKELADEVGWSEGVRQATEAGGVT